MNRTGGHPLTRALSLLRLASSRCSTAAQEVAPPFRRHRTATSVLEAIAATITRPTLHPQLLPQDPILVKGISARMKDHALLLKHKGRLSARFFVSNFPDEFSVMNHEAPAIPAFRPRYHAHQLTAGPASDASLDLLVTICEVDAAWDMYLQLGREEVSSATRLRLLDLLCAFNSRPRPLLDTDSTQIFLQKARPGIENHLVHRQHAKATWNLEGRAHELFDALEGPEKGPGYCALIRGMVRFGEYGRALELHREMRSLGFVGNRESYTALLRCVHTVQFEQWTEGGVTMKQWPWRAGLDLLYEMRQLGIEPDVETFNALLYSVSFCAVSGSIRSSVALRCFASVLKEMEALDIPVNLGTLTNALRLGYNWFSQTDDGGAPPKYHALTNIRYTEIVQYLIDRLAEDKGRKRFGTEYDKETMFLLKKAKYYFKPSIDVLMKVHRLLADSPGLFVANRLRTFYYSNLLEMLTPGRPQEAMEVFESCAIPPSGLREPLRLKILAVYAEHHPEKLDMVLEPVVRQLTLLNMRIQGENYFLQRICGDLLQSFPLIRPAVVRSLRFLWKRLDAEGMTPVSSSVVSATLALILPDVLAAEVDKRALDLAMTFYKARSDNSVSLESCLLLGNALLNSGQSADGMEILGAVVREKHVIQEQHVDLCNRAIKELCGKEEVIANSAVHQRLVEHTTGQSLFKVSWQAARTPADGDGERREQRPKAEKGKSPANYSSPRLPWKRRFKGRRDAGSSSSSEDD